MLIVKPSGKRCYLFWLGDQFEAEVGPPISEEVEAGVIGAELSKFLRAQGFRFQHSPAVHVRNQSALTDCEVQISETCNLRCAHCFVPRESLRHIDLRSFHAIVEALRRLGAVTITITGGEPFAVRNIWDYLDIVAQCHLNIRLITNGTKIDDDLITRLSAYPVTGISVSIDGFRNGHDSIRGEGNFERSIRSLEALGRSRFRPTVNTVVGRHNVGTLNGFVAEMRRHGATRVSFSRLRVHGAFQDKNQELSPAEFATLLANLGIQSRKYSRWRPTICGLPCGGGSASIAIGADGTVLPCYLLADSPHGEYTPTKPSGNLLQPCPRIRLGKEYRPPTRSYSVPELHAYANLQDRMPRRSYG